MRLSLSCDKAQQNLLLLLSDTQGFQEMRQHSVGRALHLSVPNEVEHVCTSLRKPAKLFHLVL